MDLYTSFADAVREFKKFLEAEALPSEIQWAYKQDVIQPSIDKLYLAVPLPSSNKENAQRAYESGVALDQVKLQAIGLSDNWIAATVWYPDSATQRPQGWDLGLCYAITDPLPRVNEVTRGWRWKLLQLQTRRNLVCRNSQILSVDKFE